MEGLFVIALFIIVPSGLATRYLVAGDTDEEITPIYYVIGVLFAPITIVMAIIKWLFSGKA